MVSLLRGGPPLVERAMGSLWADWEGCGEQPPGGASELWGSVQAHSRHVVWERILACGTRDASPLLL